MKFDIKHIGGLLKKYKGLKKQLGVAKDFQKPGNLMRSRITDQLKRLDIDLGEAGVTPEMFKSFKVSSVIKMAYIENWARRWLRNN